MREADVRVVNDHPWNGVSHREQRLCLSLPQTASPVGGLPPAPLKISATLAVPPDHKRGTGGSNPPEPHGVVILHGWGGPRAGPGRLLVRLSRRLAKRGFMVLRPDLPGRGESEGSPLDATLDDMIRAALVCARRLMEHEGCSRVSLVGMCSGANVAIGAVTASDWPSGASRMALISLLPFAPVPADPALPLPSQADSAPPIDIDALFSPTDLSRKPSLSAKAAIVPRPDPRAAGRFHKRLSRLREYVRKAFSWNTWKRLFRGEIDWRGVARALRGPQKASKANPATAIRDPRDSRRDIPEEWARHPGAYPTLLVYGAADPEAAAASGHYEAFGRETGVSLTIEQVENADHNFSGEPWAERVMALTVDWLARTNPSSEP